MTEVDQIIDEIRLYLPSNLSLESDPGYGDAPSYVLMGDFHHGSYRISFDGSVMNVFDNEFNTAIIMDWSDPRSSIDVFMSKLNLSLTFSLHRKVMDKFRDLGLKLQE